jgi:hypothetical protein
MSDNGAEGAIIESLPMTGDVIKTSINEHYDNSLENLGNGDSFIWVRTALGTGVNHAVGHIHGVRD